MRKQFLAFSAFIILFETGMAIYYPMGLWSLVIAIPLLGIGFNDFFQTRQAIRRNFPIFGNFRYILEMIRPEINQYFVENNADGKPFSREERSVVYQRSKRD